MSGLDVELEKSQSSSLNLDVNDQMDISEVIDDDSNEFLSSQSTITSVNLDVHQGQLFNTINTKVGIEDTNKLLKSLKGKLKQLKIEIDEFITFLEAKKHVVDQSYKKQQGAVATFSGVSIVGGGAMLIGGAGAIFTLGASFTLILAGGITVGIGTFGSVTAQIAGKARRRWVIRQCKTELRKIQSNTEEIGKLYEQLHSKCKGVCEALEEFELSIENLKEVEPIIFKFAMIGWLNTPKLAAGTAVATGTHVVRSSNVAAHVGNCLELRFLGKTIVPALKLTQAVLGIGMAITGIGIAFDLVVGGKAIYDLVKEKECSESKNISLAIRKAEDHRDIIKTYRRLLKHDAADLLKKAIASTRSIRQDIRYQNETIEHLRRADSDKAAEIKRLRKADKEKTAEIKRLRKADEEKTADIQNLWDEFKKLRQDIRT